VHLHAARYDVAHAGAGVDVGDLEAGRGEALVALIPVRAHQFGERGREEVDRILHQMRISHMALYATHRELAREGPAPTYFQHVAQRIDRARLADDAVVDKLVARLQALDDARRAVDGGAFLVGGDEERDR